MSKCVYLVVLGTVLLVGVSGASAVSDQNTTASGTEDVVVSSCLEGGPCGEGRTFGIAKRRMMFMFLPMMFKLGVILTLLVVLTVLALKGLTIGVILLIFAFGGLFAKLKSEKGHSSWGEGSPVHLHVHGSSGHASPSYPSHSSYSNGGAWDRGGLNGPHLPDPSWDAFLARKWTQYRAASLQNTNPYQAMPMQA